MLRQYGYGAAWVRDIGLRGVGDADVAAYAGNNKLCLLSTNPGFTDTAGYPPEKYYGTVVLNLPAGATSAVILSLLESLLKQGEIVDELKGKLAVVETGGIEIRQG